jgi:hypothetical protein
VSLDGGPPTPDLTAFGFQGDKVGAGVFTTLLTQLNINAGTALIRADPSTRSTGAMTITDQGGGGFQISSFFDVFTDISVDGGTTWVPATNGPTRFDLVENTPEPSTAWLLLMALGVLGVVGLRRRAY